MATTTTDLRERIHRIFSLEPETASTSHPAFWVKPTEEAKTRFVRNFHERVTLTDHVEFVRNDPAAPPSAENPEHDWLCSPNIHLDGRSPAQALEGDDHARRRLEAIVEAMEAAAHGDAFR